MYSLSLYCPEFASSVAVDGNLVTFLIDTGAAVSIINREHLADQGDRVRPTNAILRAYNQERMPTLGMARCHLKLGSREVECNLFVVAYSRSVLGRDTLAKLGMIIDCAARSCSVAEGKTIQIENEFRKLFSGTLGLVKAVQHRVRLKENVRPVQHKLRRLPLTLVTAVKAELDKQLENDVIEPV